MIERLRCLGLKTRLGHREISRRERFDALIERLRCAGLKTRLGAR